MIVSKRSRLSTMRFITCLERERGGRERGEEGGEREGRREGEKEGGEGEGERGEEGEGEGEEGEWERERVGEGEGGRGMEREGVREIRCRLYCVYCFRKRHTQITGEAA